jgi:hypothetical protein
MKLMARMMAEALVKPMFRGIFKTLTDYCMEKLSFRLNGKFVQYDPQEWRDGYDMSINVGIGTGDTSQQMQFLMMLSQSQGAIAGSPVGPMLIDAEKVYNLQARMIELAGFKNPEEFYNQPQKGPDGKVAQPPQQPPLELLLKDKELQADAQKFQAETQRVKEVETLKAQLNHQQAQRQLEIQAANDQRDAEREALRAQYENQLEQERLRLDFYKTDADNKTRIQVALINANSKAQAAQMNAEARQEQPQPEATE